MIKRQSYIHLLKCALAGSSLAWVIWSWPDRASMAALALIPVIVTRAQSRRSAWMFAMSYWAFTSRDVPVAIQRFEGMNTAWSWTIMLLYCAMISWALSWSWSSSPTRSALKVGSLSLVFILPPLGGWVFGQPILASGWIFPGSGLIGMFGLIGVWMILARFRSAAQTLVIVIVTSLCSYALHIAYEAPPPNQLLKATITNLPRYPESVSERHQYHDQAIRQVREIIASSPRGSSIVLPESVVGTDEARYSWRWQELQKDLSQRDQTLWMGVDLPIANGIYKNALQQLGKPEEAIAASVPAPIGSWRPWANTHFPANWFQSDQLNISGQTVSVLFCWEQLVPWPWVLNTLHRKKTDGFLSVSNHWFAFETSITDAHLRSGESLARLFGNRLETSINLPKDH